MKRILGYGALGLAFGLVASLALGVVAVPVFDISQREGAYAMCVIFMMLPAGALVGLIIGVIWAVVRNAR